MHVSPHIPRTIFREYDIRGLVDKEINEHTARSVTAALISRLEWHQVEPHCLVIGHDHRLSSPSLGEVVCKEATMRGWDVISLGTVPTPAYYYALHQRACGGGIMITASHNPPEFNGFKVNQGTKSLYGPQIQELYSLIQSSRVAKPSSVRGDVHSESILDEYVQAILDRLPKRGERALRVVADAGNGTAGLVIVGLLETLGCKVIPLYCEPDGTFPHHHPDPTVKANLEDLIATVISTKADMGLAFDGDSDRIGVVDEQGAIIWGDRLLAIFALDLLQRQPGSSVIYEVKCSMALEEVITEAGGKPVMYKAGHSLIKKKMHEQGALLAGEMSGHMFFGEPYFGFDDALYAAALLVTILQSRNEALSRVMQDVPNYPSTPEIRIDCAEELKTEVVDLVKERFSSDYAIIDVDGVRVLFDDGWGLLRKSNTQPILVLRFEARSPESLKQIISLFKSKLEGISGIDPSQIPDTF